MIQEANFNDIRRNFILASILLILFLLYGNKIQIEQLLIFKFNTTWDWSIISSYWDIFIILSLFFLYTFSRYCIYGLNDIKKNRYVYQVFMWIIRNANLDRSTYYKEIFSKDENWVESKFEHIFLLEDNTNKQIQLKSNSTNKYYSIPDEIKNLKISRTQIEFIGVRIEFNVKNLEKELWPSCFKLILCKEFSDFWWPLFLLVPILLIPFIKLVTLMICL